MNKSIFLKYFTFMCPIFPLHQKYNHRGLISFVLSVRCIFEVIILWCLNLKAQGNEILFKNNLFFIYYIKRLSLVLPTKNDKNFYSYFIKFKHNENMHL
jgi:hypothetical protein